MPNTRPRRRWASTAATCCNSINTATNRAARARHGGKACRRPTRCRALRRRGCRYRARRASHRPLALHRDARAGACVRPVVPHRAMLRAAIVPERDRVLGPAEAALEQRVLAVLIEVRQNRVALVARQADDVAGE